MSNYTHKVYENSTFIILQSKSCYILINKKKPFKKGHSHINSFDTCKWLMRLSRKREIPNKISPYLLQSLKRISDDKEYLKELDKLQIE